MSEPNLRTDIEYADAGYVDNRDAMNLALEYGQPVAPGVGTSAFMVGMRHRFRMKHFLA
jgi:hypothetical protein